MLFSNPSASNNSPLSLMVRAKSDWYNDAQKRWEGSVYSPDTVAVLISINGNNPLSVPVSGGRFTWTPSLPLPDGEYVLGFTSVDATNNFSKTVLVNYNIDTVAPDKPVITAIEDYVDGGKQDGDSIKKNGYTNDANPVIRGEAEANSLVYIYNKSSKTPLASVKTNAQGKWDIEVNLPNDGAYELSAVAEDQANNRSQPSLKWKFQLDTESPDGATITDYQDDVGLYRGQYNFSRVTDDARPELHGSGEPDEYVRIQYASKNGNWITTATIAVDSDGNWYWTPPNNLSDGEWSFRVRNIDHAGNAGNWSNSTTLLIDTMTTQPIILQALDDVGPMHNVFPGQTTEDARLDFSGKAEAFSLVKLYQDGMAVGSTHANIDGDWKITPLQDMRVGINNFGVKAIDLAGNESSYTANYQVKFNPTLSDENKMHIVDSSADIPAYTPAPSEFHIIDIASWLTFAHSLHAERAASFIFSGENQLIDFTAVSSRVDGLQKIDITGKGNNKLNLDLKALLVEGDVGLFINEESKQLMIDGNSGDRLAIDSVDFNDGWLISQNNVLVGGEKWMALTNSQENYTLLVNQEIEIIYC